MKGFILILVIMSQTLSAGSLTVLIDRGGVSADSVLRDYRLPEGLTTQTAPLPESVELTRVYQKSNLTPGPVTPVKISQNLGWSFFVIGDDDFSLQWLEDNVDRLNEIDAIGFALNIKSKDSLKRIGDYLGKPLLVADVDDLASHFGVKHYPFLIHNNEVMQ